MRLRKTAIAAGACAAMLIGVPLGTAQAATRPSAAAAASVRATVSARPAAAPAMLPAGRLAATCPPYMFDFYGSTGTFTCYSSIWAYDLPNGTTQDFGIGTDSAVWTAWRTSNGTVHGWVSMGGVAIVGPVVWDDSSSNAVVQVVGTDNNYWCRYRTGSTGKWGAWFECNGWTNSHAYSSYCIVNCPPLSSGAITGRAYRNGPVALP